MLWVAIGCFLCGIAVGALVRVGIDYLLGLPSLRKQCAERKQALGDKAFELLNSPYVTKSHKDEIRRIIRYHNLELSGEPTADRSEDKNDPEGR